MKIGINIKGFDSWNGGVDFIKHLSSCINIINKDKKHEITILFPKKNLIFWLEKKLYPFRNIFSQILSNKKINWISWNGFDPDTIKKFFDDLKYLDRVSPGYLINSNYSYVEKKNFDVFLPCLIPPPKKFKFKWIGYLYDFQHRYYPEYFDKRILDLRNKQIQYMLDNADHIIVNAKEVKKDAFKFFGKFKAKIHVLPFSPGVKLEWLIEEKDVREKYKIDKPFFLISNQFWIHKNHKVAFRAFKKLLDHEGKKFQLVCTGYKTDIRDPKFFDRLLEMLKKLKICESIKFLGHIPKLDQISLLKKSIAVIQPTLFEGGPGGGITYDSISVGHRIIVSDIPVNREINETRNVYFFNPHDHNDLFLKMLKLINSNFVRDSKDILWKKGQVRMKNCGNLLMKVINEKII
jgi:hypothetical protein